MAGKIYMHLSTPPGDSTDAGRVGWFDALSFSFTGPTPARIGEAGAFTVLVPDGRGAVKLVGMYTTGERIWQAVLEVVQFSDSPGGAGKPVAALAYTFDGLTVTGYTPAGGEAQLMSVTFAYQKLSKGSPPGNAAAFVRPQDRGRMMATAARAKQRTTTA